MHKPFDQKIWLSPPHLTGRELGYIKEAFQENWVAPAGPHLQKFEEEFAEKVGAKHAVALSSGTAALHLAIHELQPRPGDEILVSDLTFVATVNAICYEQCTPVMVDSEPHSWNMDPRLLEKVIKDRLERGKNPTAVLLVHVYGQPANVDLILEICRKYDLTLIEDAAESLGAEYGGQSLGTLGKMGVFSFNGNKIITTSAGGMLVTNDAEAAKHVRKLSMQAKEEGSFYLHNEIGYNYRMSNILAGLGRAQLQKLDKRVAKKKQIFAWYKQRLGEIEGIKLMPASPHGTGTRWLTCITSDEEVTGITRDDFISELEIYNIEARPLWRPMHLQPAFTSYPFYKHEQQVSKNLYKKGVCLPSGTLLSRSEVDKICSIIHSIIADA